MIEIKNISKSGFSSKSFSQVAKKVLKGENRELKKISLAFVGKKEIQELNNKFRKKDKPTDVLSFNINEGNYLGEIVICPDVVGVNAKEYRVSKKEEMIKIFIHGILHLLGYDHEKSEKEAKIMEQKQNFYLSQFI